MHAYHRIFNHIHILADLYNIVPQEAVPEVSNGKVW